MYGGPGDEGGAWIGLGLGLGLALGLGLGLGLVTREVPGRARARARARARVRDERGARVDRCAAQAELAHGQGLAAHLVRG